MHLLSQRQNCQLEPRNPQSCGGTPVRMLQHVPRAAVSMCNAKDCCTTRAGTKQVPPRRGLSRPSATRRKLPAPYREAWDSPKGTRRIDSERAYGPPGGRFEGARRWRKYIEDELLHQPSGYPERETAAKSQPSYRGRRPCTSAQQCHYCPKPEHKQHCPPSRIYGPALHPAAEH